MIIIRYKLPNNSNPQYLTFEGRLFPSKNISQTISTQWQNEDIDLQHIFSNAYEMQCNVKESEYIALQNLEYAYEIYIHIDGSYVLFDFVEFSEETIFDQFKQITIILKKVSEKEFSNVIFEKETKDLLIPYHFPAILRYDLQLNPIKKSNFTQNNVDNFKQQIDDYFRNEIYFDVRMFLNEDDFFNFLEVIQNYKYINLQSQGAIKFNFTIKSTENIAKDLYKIDLKLVQSVEITEIN